MPLNSTAGAPGAPLNSEESFHPFKFRRRSTGGRVPEDHAPPTEDHPLPTLRTNPSCDGLCVCVCDARARRACPARLLARRRSDEGQRGLIASLDCWCSAPSHWACQCGWAHHHTPHPPPPRRACAHARATTTIELGRRLSQPLDLQAYFQQLHIAQPRFSPSRWTTGKTNRACPDNAEVASSASCSTSRWLGA